MTCPDCRRQEQALLVGEHRRQHDLVAVGEADVAPADLRRSGAERCQRRSQRLTLGRHDQQVRPGRLAVGRRADRPAVKRSSVVTAAMMRT